MSQLRNTHVNIHVDNMAVHDVTQCCGPVLRRLSSYLH